MASAAVSLLSFVCGWVVTGRAYVKLQKQLAARSNTNVNTQTKKKQKNKNKPKPWVKNPLRFEEIVSNKLGFEFFTNHLVSEYSVENILFVLELEIIKDEIIEHELRVASFCYVQ